jgi:FtsP/CotA-like multicopper oxidase with cupredoxin domain
MNSMGPSDCRFQSGGKQRMEILDMSTRKRSLLSLSGLLVGLAAVVILISSQAVAAPGDASGALLQPAGGMAVTALPASTCTLVDTTRTCELWAMAGQITMPDGAVVPIWGFADNPAGPALLPGPMLIANQGETLEVILHNELPAETVSLEFPGQPGLLPDLVGVASGGSTTYSFPVSIPGTFLYEAGLTENGARQVAMGLYGALIVRPPTAGQAYDDPATAFDDEALVLLSEIDSAFNNDPYGFQMQNYEPNYWLINGKAYPETTEIETAAGNIVLLRYINAGLETHGMGLLGLRQQVIALDGRPLAWPYGVVAETIPSGQTMDALTAIPALSETGSRYALYQANLFLHNASQRVPPATVYLPIILKGATTTAGDTANSVSDATAPEAPDNNSISQATALFGIDKLAYGGMMTFLRTVIGVDPDTVGPLVESAQVFPNPTAGGTAVTITATLDDSLTGGLNVVAAEYYLDSAGLPGTGVPLTIDMPAPSIIASGVVSTDTLASLPSGYRVFYIRGQDSGGSWGPVGSAVLNLDKEGPNVSGMSLDPEPTNGSRAVQMLATGDDRANGNNAVVAGTYSIDGGTSAPMTLSTIDAPVAAMTATLAIETLQGLAEGLHPMAITAEDSLGNLGAAGIITLTLDLTGPATPTVSITPTLLDLTEAIPVTYVRLDAVITDTLSAGIQSPLANAQGFIDTVGPEGSGFNLFPSDGLFDEISEAVYFQIPVANFLILTHGDHGVYVRGLDSAGNWGIVGSATITIHRFDVAGQVYLPVIFKEP